MFYELYTREGKDYIMSLISIVLFSNSNSQRVPNENYSQLFYRLDGMGKCIICIYMESWTQGYQSNLKAHL